MKNHINEYEAAEGNGASRRREPPRLPLVGALVDEEGAAVVVDEEVGEEEGARRWVRRRGAR